MKVHGFRFCFTPLAGVLFTFPSRYYALSVAVRIQPWIVVDPDSGRVPRAPPYSGTAPARRTGFAYGAVTLCGGAVRLLPLPFRFLANSPGHPRAALQPRQKRFGLLPVRSPLLGESLLISVPELLRWFTSLSVAPVHYIFMHSGNSKLLDYSIRTSGGHRICAPHPGFSQLITSFFAWQLQGIRHRPVFA